MEPHVANWGSVAEKLAAHVAPSFDPKDAGRVEKSLVDTLHREIQSLSRDTVHTAIDATARQIKWPVDWSRFICLFLSRLPGSWSKLHNNPGFDASTMLLLTDGTVMCQEQGGLRWKKLTPDGTGSYVNGTWSDLAPMHYTRRYYASAVLKDGRVFVSGGEYSNAGSETTKTEIYSPVTDTWTEIGSPPGWSQVGDAACAVLPDGRVLLGSINSTNTAIYDPVANHWTAGPTKGSTSSEESWVLLPDDTVITVRCDSSRRADKYVAASNSWVSGGTLPTGIVETSSSEIGSGILLYTGQAFYAGANNHTALYTRPMTSSAPGSWTMGPDFPNDSNGQTVGCKDTPACLMTNGKVLVSAGPVDGVRNDYLTPTYFFEYNGASLNRVSDPANASDKPYVGRMLLLPTGQILFAAQTNEIYVYNYFSCPEAAWRPQINTCPDVLRPLHTYTITGYRFNGLSQAVGYGDDAAACTNYPLLRIRNLATGRVRYCRTFDHSTMGVATGSTLVSTQFTVPWDIDQGPSEVCVVANGISSTYFPVSVNRWILNLPVFDERVAVHLIGSLADGPLWVLGPNGPIPVDPWGPIYAREAIDARDQIVQGIKTLQKLGTLLASERQKRVEEIAPAPDDDVDESLIKLPDTQGRVTSALG